MRALSRATSRTDLGHHTEEQDALSNCGQENPRSQVLRQVATRLAAPTTPSTSVRSSPPASSSDVSQGRKLGVIVSSIFMPLLGIIMGIIYMNDPSPTKKAVGKTWLYVAVGAVGAWCLCGMASGMLQNL